MPALPWRAADLCSSCHGCFSPSPPHRFPGATIIICVVSGIDFPAKQFRKTSFHLNSVWLPDLVQHSEFLFWCRRRWGTFSPWRWQLVTAHHVHWNEVLNPSRIWRTLLSLFCRTAQRKDQVVVTPRRPLNTSSQGSPQSEPTFTWIKTSHIGFILLYWAVWGRQAAARGFVWSCWEERPFQRALVGTTGEELTYSMQRRNESDLLPDTVQLREKGVAPALVPKSVFSPQTSSACEFATWRKKRIRGI